MKNETKNIFEVVCINPTVNLMRNKIYKVELRSCFCGNHAGYDAYRDYYLIEFSPGRFINVSPKRFKKI